MATEEYDPSVYEGVGRMPTLYASNADGSTNQWTCWIDGAHVHTEWGHVGGSMQRSTFACQGKNEGKKNSTTAEEQALKECRALWKKQVKKKYRLSVAVPDARIRPMLAQEFGKREKLGKVSYPCDVQPKLDGVRCLAYRKEEGAPVALWSRGGEVYDVEHVRRALDARLPAGVVLDGELYVHGMSLQKLNSLVRRPQPESAVVTYCAYDCAPMDESLRDGMPWVERRALLQKLYLGAPNECLKLVPTETVTDRQEVHALHGFCTQAGYEGVIVRLHHGKYDFGRRSPELLKLKTFQDAEFQIIGWRPGRGKFASVPVFRCVTSEGKEFDVVPAGTKEECLELLVSAKECVGKMLTVKFFDWTDAGIPHFPVGKGIREAGT